MGTFEIKDSSFARITHEGETIRIIKKEIFDGFNEDVLGLGQINTGSNR